MSTFSLTTRARASKKHSNSSEVTFVKKTKENKFFEVKIAEKTYKIVEKPTGQLSNAFGLICVNFTAKKVPPLVNI